MKKLARKDIVQIICIIVWFGTAVAMYFIRHWTVVFVALLHCASLWVYFSKAGKSIQSEPKKTQIELERDLAEYNAKKEIEEKNKNEYMLWDILDDD